MLILIVLIYHPNLEKVKELNIALEKFINKISNYLAHSIEPVENLFKAALPPSANKPVTLD